MAHTTVGQGAHALTETGPNHVPELSHDLLVRARRALLDALEALRAHADSIIVVGAQAIYLHTGDAPVAVAEATKDSDLVVDPRALGEDPLVQQAMDDANFEHDPTDPQPGAWFTPSGIPVDLMVPRAMDGTNKKDARAAKLPPHDKYAFRSATGLEAAIIDNAVHQITALNPDEDDRVIAAKVASPSALIIAKAHKIYERKDKPTRLSDKDAHDLYRLLMVFTPEQLLPSFRHLATDVISTDVTTTAVGYLEELFGASPAAVGCAMVARTEGAAGEDADVIANRCHFLAADLIEAVRTRAALGT